MKKNVVAGEVMWLVVLIAIVVSVPSPVAALNYSKFAAWSSKWYDTPIPLQVAGLDPRQDRQYDGSSQVTSEVLAFAAAYPGQLYIVSDEPDLHCISPADYAEDYKSYVEAVLAVDPTARFSPAGFTFANPCSGPASTAYAEAFIDAYRNLAGGSNPPVAE
ncbi:MAG: hypothetical protein AB7I50_05230 [Vicinamibacterales bacterium]